MSIPKVCGIETEYGIMVRGADSNPVTASSLLINAYLAVNYRKVGWDLLAMPEVHFVGRLAREGRMWNDRIVFLHIEADQLLRP